MPCRFSSSSVFLNDYPLSHTCTSHCNLYGKSLSLDCHHTSAATSTTSRQSGALSRNCTYLLFLLPVTKSPPLYFIHHISCLFVRWCSGSSFAQIFKTWILEFPENNKNREIPIYFNQSVIYTCGLYTESLIGSQAT